MDHSDGIDKALHELAEGLQAASYFLTVLQEGPHGLSPSLVERTAQQLARASESFNRLRDHLDKSQEQVCRTLTTES